ncbi:hypothetical protein FCL39_022940, partial [Enterobacter hormaechei]|uniref:hypothetical protein n=1 Tax=Enterobacter hormaechei TaxID=158836 RepID=UPI00159EC373
VNTEVYRLRTYPALYADEQAFYPNPINEFIGSLTAVLDKPAVAGVASAGGVFPHFGYTANFGSATSVTLYDGLYQSDLQTDGKYSPVFYAYDSDEKPLAYASFLDQAVDPTNPNATFTVSPGDWRTDLQTVRVTITNYEGSTNADGSPGGFGYFCTGVTGFRKGVAIRTPY